MSQPVRSSSSTETPVAPAQLTEEQSGLKIFWRRLRRGRGAVLSLVVILCFVLAAILAPVLTSHDPIKPNLLGGILQPPSMTNPLGTDDLGRDTLARLLYGARVSLSVGVIAVGIALTLGVSLGLVAGYFRGRAESLIMRLMDTILAFPSLVLALAITAVLGANLTNAMIAIGLVSVPQFARLVRAQVLSVSNQEFVEASRSLGARDFRIISRHVLPNILAPVIVQSSLTVAAAILAEAGLSFLGLGVQPPTPSWGSMVSQGRAYLEMAPWMIFAPGGAIFMVVLAFNFLGDGVRDALDPRMKGR